jgi:hypothetical protein
MKTYGRKSSKSCAPGTVEAKSQKFRDRNLMGTNPLKEQFEPTPAEPVRQRYKMGGGC